MRLGCGKHDDYSASPTSKDQVEAEAAVRRGSDGTTILPGATGAVMQSEDPQIHGMDAYGATGAAYRAAYRVCMRKRGFWRGASRPFARFTGSVRRTIFDAGRRAPLVSPRARTGSPDERVA